MPLTPERLTCAVLSSVPPSFLQTLSSLSGEYLFKRDGTKSTIESFKSWDTCMDNHVCKIVVIVLIVVGALLFIWLFGGIIRCMCCGATMVTSLCCCLSSMCSCCSGSDNRDKHRHEQSQPPPAPYYNNGGYQQAPAMNSDIYTRNGPDLASAPLPSQVYNGGQTNNPLYNYGEERFGSNGELARREKEQDQENLQRLRIKREIYEEEKQARKRQEEELQNLKDSNPQTNQFDDDKLPDSIINANQHAYNRANNIVSPTEDHFGEPVAPLNVINPDGLQPSYPAHQENFYTPYNNNMNNNLNHTSNSYASNINGYEMQNLAPRNPFVDQNLQGITAFNPAEYLQKQKQQEDAAKLPDPSNLVTSENSNIMYPRNTEVFTGMKESPSTVPTPYYGRIYPNNNSLNNSNENMSQAPSVTGQEETAGANVKPYNTALIHPQQLPSDSDFVRKSINLSNAHNSLDLNSQGQSPNNLNERSFGQITSESPLIGQQRTSIVGSNKSSSRNSLYVSPLFGSKGGKTGGHTERFSNISNTRKDTLNGITETYDDSDFVKTPLIQPQDQQFTDAARLEHGQSSSHHLPYPPSNSIL